MPLLVICLGKMCLMALQHIYRLRCTVQLLDLDSGETVVQLYQKGMSKESWPALQLTSDEVLLAHMVNNTINIYKTRAFAEGKSVFLSMHALRLRCMYTM